MSFIGQLGMQLAQGVLGGGLGSIFGNIGNNQQYKQQEKLQALQIKGQKELTDYNTMKQLQMWMDTNYPAQVEQLKKAGLNPALLYGHGGGGGATASVTPGNVSGGNAENHASTIMQTAMGLNTAMQSAQIEALKAQTNKTNVEAAKIAGVDTTEAKGRIALMNLDIHFYQQTMDARIQELDRRIEKMTQEAREIDQRVGITADTREATVNKAQQDAIGAALQNILIGENTKATTQQINESKARVGQMAEQIKKWQEEIKQGWEGLSLKDKELRLNAIMKEVEAVTTKKGIADIPALTPNQRRQVIRQIDKIARIGEGDYQ